MPFTSPNHSFLRSLGEADFAVCLHITLWQSLQQMNLHPCWCQNSSLSIDLAVKMGFLLQLLFANDKGKMLKLTFRWHNKRNKEVGIKKIALYPFFFYVREINFNLYCLSVLYPICFLIIGKSFCHFPIVEIWFH